MPRPIAPIVWQALSDPTRRRILDLLRAGPATTGQICEEFPLSRFAVMKHLGVLEEAKLLSVRRRGRERWNYINVTPLRKIHERWLTPYQQLWASSLSNLGTVVDGGNSVTITDTQEIRKFKIEQEVELAATPARVFEALTVDVRKWWAHITFDSAGHTPNLQIESKVGGKFFEVSGQKAILYALVTRYEPGVSLWLEGSMGMKGALSGWIAFQLEPYRETSAKLKLSHHVVGDVDQDTMDMYAGGWTQLLSTSLKKFVEQGEETWSAA